MHSKKSEICDAMTVLDPNAIRRINSLRLRGLSYAEIAEITGLGKTTVGRVLKGKVTTGRKKTRWMPQ